LKRRVVFLRPAREELATAAEWYEERRPGLGVELVAEIDEAVAQLSEQPQAWPLWRVDRPYRKRALDRFPYVVFYALTASGDIEIAAVAHASRKPGYWLERRS
jgi:plasmid stabilization system protein ParE